ncbi:hypothetical protein [Microbacterium sp. BK668]|uniref:sensor histidine kinase n=1 Tax=Microbacterium sp. BK668 TaxID=2512118 RepID=UPI001061F268|nr:hypothetical protein [Microbacterium sp. BK668]
MTTAVAAARAGIVAAGAMWGGCTASVAYDVDALWLWATDAVVVIAFALVSAAALPRHPGLAITAGASALAWSLGSVLPAAVFWHRGAIVLLLLAAPRAWPASPLARTAVITAIVVSVPPTVWGRDAAALVLAVALVVVLTICRRVLAEGALPAGLLFAAVIAGSAVWHVVAPDPALLGVRAVVYALGVAAVAALFLVGERRTSAVRTADELISLPAGAEGLSERLAAAVGDPGLRVGRWDGDRAVFEDAEGRPLDNPRPGRTVVLFDGAERIAVVADAGRLSDPAVREGIRRVTALALERDRLDRELALRLTEVALSKARLIDAAEEEREQLRHRLDCEVGEPLRHLVGAIEDAVRDSQPAQAEHLERARASAGRALDDLIALKGGLPPATLAEGLAPALRGLAEGSPVRVEVTSPERIDAGIATTVFFVCAEAFANAIKHARATVVRILVEIDAGVCRATIEDDGTGRAEVVAGGGLHGLRERVEARSGALRLETSGDGTRVIAELPVSAAGVPA